MTKDKTVTMSRELIEVVAKEMDRLGYGHHEHHAESILHVIRSAATVVERQPEPSLWLVRIPEEPEDPEESPAEYVHAGSTYELSSLLKRPGATIDQVYYTSPPAPVAINVRMAGILQSLRTNANPALFAPGQLAEVDACLDKVKELNQ